MDRKEILAKITEIVGDELGNDDIELREETLANEVEGWDSLAHVRIMIALEQNLGVQFDTSEIVAMKNVGDLVSLIGTRV